MKVREEPRLSDQTGVKEKNTLLVLNICHCGAWSLLFAWFDAKPFPERQAWDHSAAPPAEGAGR